jgi:hypothetical protein
MKIFRGVLGEANENVVCARSERTKGEVSSYVIGDYALDGFLDPPNLAEVLDFFGFRFFSLQESLLRPPCGFFCFSARRCPAWKGCLRLDGRIRFGENKADGVVFV